MKLNWTVRLKNKNIWISFVPACLLLVQTVLAAFGVTIDAGAIGNIILGIVDAAFVVLTILGVVNDPTTAGVSDSAQAMTYTTPKK
jgi:phi LC3 family holin